MIKVAIADDQVLLREMLSMILTAEEGIEVVGLAGNGEEIISLCRETAPDLALLDLKMPGSGGIHALEAIKKEMPHIKAVMLTTFSDEKSVLEAFQKGADGYVLKDIKPELLAMAVRCAYYGLFVMQESVAGLVRENIKPGASRRFDKVEDLHDEYGLDVIDRKLIRLLVEGKSNREIGESLSYSEGTIKNRITRILSVTGLKDRTQIAVFALQNNII